MVLIVILIVKIIKKILSGHKDCYEKYKTENIKKNLKDHNKYR